MGANASASLSTCNMELVMFSHPHNENHLLSHTIHQLTFVLFTLVSTTIDIKRENLARMNTLVYNCAKETL